MPQFLNMVTWYHCRNYFFTSCFFDTNNIIFTKKHHVVFKFIMKNKLFSCSMSPTYSIFILKLHSTNKTLHFLSYFIKPIYKVKLFYFINNHVIKYYIYIWETYRLIFYEYLSCHLDLNKWKFNQFRIIEWVKIGKKWELVFKKEGCLN
jgi:hypothetical protein